ncbi:MAG: DUF2492 family protein [Elusimicrobia bacterium]|nr:DUF2492 family protein [Elusimicrobiota bacterium]
MNASIHGHEVMKRCWNPRPFTAESLEQAIHGWFGDFNAVPHVLGEENLTAGELVDFLAARNKFVGGPSGFRVCGREHLRSRIDCFSDCANASKL